MMMPMGTNLAGFELSVRDLERAEAFYVTSLGLRVRAREDHGFFRESQLVGEGDTVALLLVCATDPAGTSGAPLDSTKLVLSVDDVRSLYASAVEAGAEGSQAPQHDAASNVWFAEFRDLDGHHVLLVQGYRPT